MIYVLNIQNYVYKPLISFADASRLLATSTSCQTSSFRVESQRSVCANIVISCELKASLASSVDNDKNKDQGEPSGNISVA